ncbi:signal peptidase I [Thalassolituus maritimus]
MPSKWFAAALGFFIQPVAFVYLSKFRWAFFYLLTSILFGVIDLYLERTTGYAGIALLLSVICGIHAFKASKMINFGASRKWYSNWWGVLLILLVFYSSIFSIRAFLYEPFQVPSSAMSPTLKAGDHVVVSKYGYGLYGTLGVDVYSSETDSRRKPQRGEVFFLYPPHDERLFIERIIGLPNDVVEFSDKQLYINGAKVETRRLGSSHVYTETLDGNTYSVQYIRDGSQFRNFKVVVPKNSYFVMGDNRDNSADSRVWGMVPAENIMGKLVLTW